MCAQMTGQSSSTAKFHVERLLSSPRRGQCPGQIEGRYHEDQ